MADLPPAQTVPGRKNRIERPRPLKWRHHIGAFLIYLTFRLISLTWRCRFHDSHGFLNQSHGPTIFALWHNRLALSMTIWLCFKRRGNHPARLAALISASHDGGLLAQALRYFGVDAVRGSSSRRGAQALLELTSFRERGYSVAITPDGPRGPRYVIQDGIIGLAQLSGSPILPVSTRIRWKITLKSWDRFQIPLPFSRCDIFIGSPLSVPREATEEERAILKQELQKRMMTSPED